MNITDSRAVLVSREAYNDPNRHLVIRSNIDVVNLLFEGMLHADEIAAEALQSYFVDYLYAQVMNGGFSQFVFNSRWSEKVVPHVRAGLIAIGATRQHDMLEVGADFIAHAGRAWLDDYLASDYFGDNEDRDRLDDAVSGDIADELRDRNATWLRSLPNLVVANHADILAEVERRSNALSDRAERIAQARAAEPRDLRLIRALCEHVGHELDRRTAAGLRMLDGEKVWCYFFVTDRGPHFMIDLGTSAVMFPTDRGDIVDMRRAIAKITCAPE
jgi:hypothetical protein